MLQNMPIIIVGATKTTIAMPIPNVKHKVRKSLMSQNVPINQLEFDSIHKSIRFDKAKAKIYYECVSKR